MFTLLITFLRVLSSEPKQCNIMFVFFILFVFLVFIAFTSISVMEHESCNKLYTSYKEDPSIIYLEVEENPITLAQSDRFISISHDSKEFKFNYYIQEDNPDSPKYLVPHDIALSFIFPEIHSKTASITYATLHINEEKFNLIFSSNRVQKIKEKLSEYRLVIARDSVPTYYKESYEKYKYLLNLPDNISLCDDNLMNEDFTSEGVKPDLVDLKEQTKIVKIISKLSEEWLLDHWGDTVHMITDTGDVISVKLDNLKLKKDTNDFIVVSEHEEILEIHYQEQVADRQEIKVENNISIDTKQ